MNIAPTDFISCRNLQSVLEFSLSRAMALSGTGLGNIQLVDWKTGRMTIAAQFGFQERFLSFFRHVIATDLCACGRALRTRNTVLIEDVDQDEDVHGCRTILREAGVYAVQSTPLISSSGALLGILSTHFGAPHRPVMRELEDLKLWARETANAIIYSKANALDKLHLVSASRAAVAQSYDLLTRIDNHVTTPRCGRI